MQGNDTAAASDKKTVHIKSNDLPLCCPLPGSSAWDSHPRVYLPIEQTADKQISCPYCGDTYMLDQE